MPATNRIHRTTQAKNTRGPAHVTKSSAAKTADSVLIQLRLNQRSCNSLILQRRWESRLMILQRKSGSVSRHSYCRMLEIQKFQKCTELAIKRTTFQRVVRDVMQELKCDFRFKVAALAALQEASESYLVKLFEDINLLSTHADEVTIIPPNIFLG